ncbi:MAG: MarR family transcriptional regulator [Spirochaetales bacterium]|nr:MarR family transcriptional regulator [Spirochaetales bacterium]
MNKDMKLALDTFTKLVRAESSLQKALSLNDVLKGELTPSQFAVLEALLHKGDMGANELSQKILKTKGNMTMVIDNLEKKNLVIRKACPNDRRKTYICLTSEGKVLIEEIFPRQAREISKCFQVLTAEEQRTLGSLCKKLGTGIIEE